MASDSTGRIHRANHLHSLDAHPLEAVIKTLVENELL